MMLPSETMIWQPEFTDKTLSRKPGAVHSASVYIDDAERMAEQQSDMVKKIVFDTLKELYKKDSS
ncbi:hypothetical protein [Escherichia coli]|uniref:hypothetical protein n=1 Tax=Escherichia coli TaxID=562 RepID=UPI001FCE945C|nr:hypothetical protein [Escherichia coli]